MEKYESVLKFIKYEVDEISFKKNKEFKTNENNKEGLPIDLKIKPTVKIEENNMNILLQVRIFENMEKNNAPFEIKIDITGYFKVSGTEPERLKANAIAILYPYVRALVSTYTANANISPLILPAINVNKLIEDQKKN